MQQILCVAFSTAREWDQQNVIITGSTDGVVRMWSMEHVQVPIEVAKPKNNSKDVDDTLAAKEKEVDDDAAVSITVDVPKVDLVKQMSITQEDNGKLLL